MKTPAIFALILLGLLPATLRAEPVITKDDLTDCKVEGGDCWTFKGGLLTGESILNRKGSILWTKRRFKDFTLRGEFRYSGEIDSGIFIRSEVDQIQIGTSVSLKRDMTGSPYISTLARYPVEAKPKVVKDSGDWNQFVITAEGKHYVVVLNGKQVLDWRSDTAVPEGPIGFQVHMGIAMKIEFRNLVVDAMSAD